MILNIETAEIEALRNEVITTFNEIPSPQTMKKLTTQYKLGYISLDLLRIIARTRSIPCPVDDLHYLFNGELEPFYHARDGCDLDMYLPNSARRLASKPLHVAEFLWHYMPLIAEDDEEQLCYLDVDFHRAQMDILEDTTAIRQAGGEIAKGLAEYELPEAPHFMLTSPSWARYWYLKINYPKAISQKRMAWLKKQGKRELCLCTDNIPDCILEVLDVERKPPDPNREEDVARLADQLKWINEAVEQLDKILSGKNLIIKNR